MATKERVLDTFSDLEGHRDLLSDCISEWRQLQGFLSELETSLQHRLEELVHREKAFEEENEETKQALERRDDAIFLQEAASLARLQEQKVAALAALEKERHMYLDGEKGADANTSAPATVSESLGKPSEKQAAKSDRKAIPTKVRVRPEIKSLCAIMDGDGLRKYIVDHRGESTVLQCEILQAFQSAIDPSRLVLKALEGFHLLGLNPSRTRESGASANLRACILLLECLSEVLADPVLGVDHPVVPSDVRDSAKKAAKLWKSKTNSSEGEPEYKALKAHAFVQLLVTFGIASEYNADELFKLVTLAVKDKQMPALCRSLGLTAYMPDLVDKLNQDGKALECLAFAHHFGLMDRVQPVPMLNAFIVQLHEHGQNRVKNAPNPETVQHYVLMRELVVIKAVVKAVMDYNLASQYPLEKLLDRAEQLGKIKAAKKADRLIERMKTNNRIQKMKAPMRNASNTTKLQVQSKKARVSGEITKEIPPRSAAVVGFYTNLDHGSTTVPAYERPGLSSNEQRSQANYNSLHAKTSISPGAIQSSYLYPADIVHSSFYQSASAYSDPLATYASYQYGNGLPTASAYRLPYLH